MLELVSVELGWNMASCVLGLDSANFFRSRAHSPALHYTLIVLLKIFLTLYICACLCVGMYKCGYRAFLELNSAKAVKVEPSLQPCLFTLVRQGLREHGAAWNSICRG